MNGKNRIQESIPPGATGAVVINSNGLDPADNPESGALPTISDTGWEWNLREQWGTLLLNGWVSETEARMWLESKFPRTLIRRQKAGPEEVVT